VLALPAWQGSLSAGRERGAKGKGSYSSACRRCLTSAATSSSVKSRVMALGFPAGPPPGQINLAGKLREGRGNDFCSYSCKPHPFLRTILHSLSRKPRGPSAESFHRLLRQLAEVGERFRNSKEAPGQSQASVRTLAVRGMPGSEDERVLGKADVPGHGRSQLPCRTQKH